MSDNDPNVPASVPSNDEQQAALKEAQAAEADEFFADLEKTAEANKYEWMNARVPPNMREAFNAKYPPPEPDAPTAAFKATQDMREGKDTAEVPQTAPVNPA